MGARAALRRVGVLASVLPFLLLFPLYRLGMRLLAEVGIWRTVGTAQALAALALVLVVPVALWVPAPRRASAWLVAGVALQVALVGLAIWFGSPRLAPVGVQAAALVALAGFTLLFWRKPAEERALVARALVGLGAAGWVGLALALPLVGWQALAERTLARATPAPPEGAALLAARPARVVLVTLDALRYESALAMPHLGALARRSAWYNEAHSVSDATLVSMPSILTGATIPQWRAARAGGADSTLYVREGRLTGLAGYLAPAGYRSYYATMLVQPTLFGIAQEFVAGRARASAFLPGINTLNGRAFLPLSPLMAMARGIPGLPPDEAGAIAQTFKDALAAYRRDDPHAFVWAHLGGAHEPYRRMEHLPGGRLRPVRGTRVDFWNVLAADAAGLARIEALYEDNVRYLDQELGDFVAGLEADPRWGSTLLVVTADHGQDFRLHSMMHGTGRMTEYLTHVPLVIHQPGQEAGLRVDGPVTAFDVVPSVLAHVYREPPALAGIALGASLPPRIVYSWGLYHGYTEAPGQQASVAAYEGRYKYVYRQATGTERLVDWTVKPPRPVEKQEVLARLRDYVRRELPFPGRAGG